MYKRSGEKHIHADMACRFLHAHVQHVAAEIATSLYSVRVAPFLDADDQARQQGKAKLSDL